MASSKQQLLVPLIVSVVITLAMIVTVVVFYQYNTDLNIRVKSAADTEKKAKEEKDQALRQVASLKAKLGYPDLDFGVEAPAATGLMLQIAEDMQKYGDPNNPTYKDALARQSKLKTDRETELAQVRDQKTALQKNFDNERGIKRTEITQHADRRQRAEDDLANQQKDMERKQAASDEQVQDLTRLASRAKEETNQVTADFERYKSKKDREVNLLSNEVGSLKSGQERLRYAGKPVGTVLSVDYRNKEVYVDIGEADRLPLQATFSVWSADKRGTPYWKDKDEEQKKRAAQEFEDSAKKINLEPHPHGGPKAYIEVVSLGPRQSVARITRDNVLDPITPGDQLYSPIWSPGERKHFALVGRFDMTGKGTDDRALLIAMIQKQGGVIDCEVKDDGTIGGDPGEITPQTNWLVKALDTLPDSTDTTDPIAKYVDAIRRAATRLESDAKRLSVEVIDQDKLYDYMGYKRVSRKYETGAYTGGPEPAKRFENPASTTRPSGLPKFESGAGTRAPGLPGKAKY